MNFKSRFRHCLEVGRARGGGARGEGQGGRGVLGDGAGARRFGARGALGEVAAAGVRICAASDNVRDWWHPYGDYDGLSTWKAALTLGHLDTSPNEGAWAHIVSDAPAHAIDSVPSEEGASFAVGAVADLILFPSARRISELLSRPLADRVVLRAGRVQSSVLPSYDEVDDLVATPTVLEADGEKRVTVQRGATAVIMGAS